MSNQSQLETVMGNRNYSLESAFNGLGSQVSLKLLRKRCLVLPPQIKSATDTANIHYEGVRGLDEFAYAYGMISEAESFIDNWPMRNRDFSRTTRAWSLSGVDVKLMVTATPEWVALTNMIALVPTAHCQSLHLHSARSHPYGHPFKCFASVPFGGHSQYDAE